ncbi:MAG: alkaline phosphatase family protein [Candidatus Binataceae bacterium]
MKKFTAVSILIALLAAGNGGAAEGPVPTGIPKLDHVFVIMMENHVYGQIATNPQAPFINGLMGSANLATNYFAIAHPSSTNYLEVTGGSNFNNLSDQYPNWHNTSCTPNMLSHITNVDVKQSSFPSVVGTVCPIAGSGGTDANVPAEDLTNNEGTPPLTNLNGMVGVTPDTDIIGETIADELVARHRSWKSYQEGLPIIGADGLNVSDGFYNVGGNNALGNSVSTDFSKLSTSGNPTSASDIVFLYAVKHDPFAYFASVQEGNNPALSVNQIVPFDGENGLYADLRKGTVPTFAFIAPNQCEDMHGRGNGTAFCNFDSDDNGSQTGLNPTLILQGDLAVQRIVTSIKASQVWSKSKSAIVILWDENDYSTSTSNQVVLIVNTNYGPQKIQSSTFYNHYSLTKTLDAAFGLPCLNHACDQGVDVMADLFQN